MEHISVFTDNPVEANQNTWVPARAQAAFARELPGSGCHHDCLIDNNIEVHVPTWATLDYIKEIVTEHIRHVPEGRGSAAPLLLA